MLFIIAIQFALVFVYKEMGFCETFAYICINTVCPYFPFLLPAFTSSTPAPGSPSPDNYF